MVVVSSNSMTNNKSFESCERDVEERRSTNHESLGISRDHTVTKSIRGEINFSPQTTWNLLQVKLTMGMFLSTLWQRFTPSQEFRLLLLGLDAAGKTTILYKLKLAELVTTIPTIGFNVETVQYKNLNFTMWDVGGQGKIRPLWRHYFQGTHGLIFVVDSNDRDRIEEAAEELHGLLSHDDLRDAKLLVFANKQDLPDAMPATEMVDKLNLRSLSSTEWYIQACAATSGDGLYEGLDWLSKAVTKH